MIDLLPKKMVVATRYLSLHGKADQVEIAIGKPTSDGEDYVCRYQITGVGAKRIGKVRGIDGIHAIQLTLRILEIELLNLKTQHPDLDWPAGEPGSFGF